MSVFMEEEETSVVLIYNLLILIDFASCQLQIGLIENSLFFFKI